MTRRQLQAQIEQARRRAVELGGAGDARAINELIELCRHSGPTVRRAAASALGKLAANEGIRGAVPALCALTRDAHPQVRQYALLALGKIGDESTMPSLRDAANRPTEPNYILSAALRAIEQIEDAVRARQVFGPIACSRCGQTVTREERELSTIEHPDCGHEFPDAEEDAGYRVICDTVDWLRSKDIDLWRKPLPRDVYAARQQRGENY
jgi:hypothetical protein